MKISSRKRTSLVFAHCTFHSRAEFEGSFGSIILVGSVFLEDVDFSNSDFHKIDCTNATFRVISRFTRE